MPSDLMEPYDDALREILRRGVEKKDRTGVGTISVGGLQRVYDISGPSFPFVTRRQLFPKAVWAELIWFLSGSTLNQDLEALGAKFWGKWCDEGNEKYRALRKRWGYQPGDFGPIYAFQLRNFGSDYVMWRAVERIAADRKAGRDSREWIDPMDESVPRVYLWNMAVDKTMYADADMEKQVWLHQPHGFDQLKFVIDTLKNDPFGSDGRRCLFSLWNPPDLKKMALPPCHFVYHAVPNGDGTLTGILTQRSCDFPVGVPYNIAFYSALTIMLAHQAGMRPREFVHETHDSHIYLNQIEKVEEYLSLPSHDSPTLRINHATDIYGYKPDDFVIDNYQYGPRIDMPVAV
jgi:thymidylate synthase